MNILTQRDKAYARLSKLAKLKVDLDAATNIEAKFRAAITHGHLPLIQYFLQNGLTPETSLGWNVSAISLAINYCGQSLDTMHLFFKSGLFIHYKDGNNNNALHWIIEEIQGHVCFFRSNLDIKIELFKIILASGCDLEQINRIGKTPLQLLEENDLLETEKGQKNKILNKLHDAIEEVRSGRFQYINPLPEISSISPEQLVLSPQEENEVALFQSQDYEKIGNSHIGFSLTSSEHYIQTFFSKDAAAKESLKKAYDEYKSFFSCSKP